jgi:signal peptidase I
VRIIGLALASLAFVGCGDQERASEPRAVAAAESLEVVGASMEPTLHCARPARGCAGRRDDEVLVRDEQELQRREIVSFRAGPKARARCGAGGLYVKRVVALSGDRVSFEGGSVYVNGRRLHEPYANGPTDADVAGTEIHVPADHVFVLGDNRAESCDSRVWGPLAVRKVTGVAFAIQRGQRRIPLP